jgi:hypothetical protein
MSERDDHNFASHIAFPYFFSEFPVGTPSGGIWLREEPIIVIIAVPITTYKDLLIYYDTLTDNDFIECWCSRWDIDNYSVIAETWLKEDEYNTIKDNTRPGAVAELFNILGKPHYYDKSWSGKNTLRLKPNPLSHSTLPEMRKDTIIYVKNITTYVPDGVSGFIYTKIEGYISGSTL